MKSRYNLLLLCTFYERYNINIHSLSNNAQFKASSMWKKIKKIEQNDTQKKITMSNEIFL